MEFGRNLLKIVFLFPRRVLLFSIRLYQKTVSPDHGPLKKFFYPAGYCKFNPSCSEYGYMAIKKYGLVRGSIRAIWRVLRCNPWNSGGEDQLK